MARADPFGASLCLILVGSSTILVYALFGGMWAVAITDLLQMIVIMWRRITARRPVRTMCRIASSPDRSRKRPARMRRVAPQAGC